LRNYSLSGPPGAGYYRVTVKREPGGVASSYLHTRLTVGDQLDIAAARGTFILDQTHALVLLISAGIGATPVLAMLQALAQTRSDREIWWLHGARNRREHPFAAEVRALLATLPNARAHVYYSRPDPNDLEGRDFDSAGRLTDVVLAELKPPSNAEATLQCRGLPVWAHNLHGRDQRRYGRLGVRCLPHPHRTVRAGRG
jgi:ferredoxin-NADP reductase